MICRHTAPSIGLDLILFEKQIHLIVFTHSLSQSFALREVRQPKVHRTSLRFVAMGARHLLED
jgi:hypothetical protein